MFVDQFTKDNDFTAALNGGGIAVVTQDDKQYDDDEYGNTDEESDNPTGISLKSVSARGKVSHAPTRTSSVTPSSGPTRKPSGNSRSDHTRKLVRW